MIYVFYFSGLQGLPGIKGEQGFQGKAFLTPELLLWMNIKWLYGWFYGQSCLQSRCKSVGMALELKEISICKTNEHEQKQILAQKNLILEVSVYRLWWASSPLPPASLSSKQRAESGSCPQLSHIACCWHSLDTTPDEALKKWCCPHRLTWTAGWEGEQRRSWYSWPTWCTRSGRRERRDGSCR